MERTSVGEYVLWRGQPREVALTSSQRALFWGLVVFAACAAAMALAAWLMAALRFPTLLVFGAWCATFAVALRFAPQWWHQHASYLVTDKRVLWKRGRFGRSIEREGISFARIRWYPGERRVGDLELVRDVPTGALHRRLTLLLRGVERPDLVWDVIRGLDPDSVHARESSGPLPVSQRLEEGERVVWSDRPVTSWLRFVPATGREVAALLMGAGALFAVVLSVRSAIPATRHVLEGGVSPGSPGFVALVASLSLSTALPLGIGAAIVWSAIVQPALLHSKTRYWITDRRVMIARGDEELHLERSRIVDVIDAPAARGTGMRDLFLILDGPRARAVAVQGAFNEGPKTELRPVLRGVTDAALVEQILRRPSLAA